MRRRLTRALVLVLAAALTPLMLELLGRQMLYPAPPVRVSSPPAPLTEVMLELPGDVAAVAWSGRREAGGDGAVPAVLFFHGNGENLETLRWSGLYDELTGLGVHFLAVDYPGYGKSGGRPGEASLIAAGEAGLAWLEERYAASPKVVVGWSLGAAVASAIAARHGEATAGLVLLSAWDDLESLAAVHFPRWLVGLGLADRWDSRARAAAIRAPVLQVHGEDDDIIPIAHGRRLHQALAAGSRFVALPGTGHNDLLARHEVWQELGAFLRQIAARAAGPPE